MYNNTELYILYEIVGSSFILAQISLKLLAYGLFTGCIIAVLGHSERKHLFAICKRHFLTGALAVQSYLPGNLLIYFYRQLFILHFLQTGILCIVIF